MQLSRCWLLVSLLTTVVAQVNLEVLAELPTCAMICAVQTLPPAGCDFEDISSCLCTNTTLQGQLSVCVQTTCNRTEQYSTISVSQNLICKGALQPSRSAEIILRVTIISAVAFPIVILRIFSRCLITRMWWDDWLIVAAAASMVPVTISAIYCATKGFGKHAWDVLPEDINEILELYYIAQIFYVLVQNLTKISILLLFLRIFPSKRFRRVTKVAILWMICHTIAFFMAVTLQCLPIRAVSDLTQTGKCIDAAAVVTAGAGFSIFEDIVIILLPVRELKSLQLSLRKRLAVMAMFALGSFACITSMIRLKYLTSYSVQNLDTSWDCVDIVVWSIIETYTAVICACLITIRPLLAKYIPSIFRGILVSDTPSWPYVTSRPFSTAHPQSLNSKSVGPGLIENPESAAELQSSESGIVCMDEESSHDDGYSKKG